MRQIIVTSVIIVAIATHIMLRFVLAGTFQPSQISGSAILTGPSASYVLDASFINDAATEADEHLVDDKQAIREGDWKDALTMIGK